MTVVTKDTPWRNLGRVPYAVWQKRINDAGGLSRVAAYEVWLAAGDDSALMLAFLGRESSYASDFDAIPASYNDPWNLQIDGKGIKFATVTDCVNAWRERLYSATYKNGIYAKTVTIADLIGVYAPASDGNNTTAYINGVVSDLNRNGFDPPVTTPSTPAEPVPGKEQAMATKSRFGRVPRPTFTNREIPSSQNMAWDDLGQREVRGIFLHRMEGSLWGTDEYFRTFARAQQTKQGGLTDFGIDATTGEALLWCESTGRKSPWASGPVQNPIKSAAIFVNLYGRNAVNQYAESIETSGWGGDAVSARWRAWVVAEIAYQADRYGAKLDAKGQLFDYTTYPNIPSEQNREFVMSHGWAYDGKRTTCAGSVIEALIPTINREVQAILAQYQADASTEPAQPTTPATPTPTEEVLPGLDYDVAARLFNGNTAKGVLGEDGKNYPFDRNGPVSKLWLANGKQTGQWPALVAVYSYESGKRRYFMFANGATVLAVTGQAPRWLREAVAA